MVAFTAAFLRVREDGIGGLLHGEDIEELAVGL